MSESEFKPVPKRVENIIKGLFVILFSIVIAINVGKVARTLAFPLLYLFGLSYYFVLAYFIFTALYRLIKQEKFKFKYKSSYAALILLLFSSVFVSSYAIIKSSGATFNNVNVGDVLTSFHSPLNNYYSVKYINAFSNTSFTGIGLFGVLFSGLIANDSIVLFVGIVLFVLSIFLFVVHYLFGRKEKKTKAERKKDREEAKRVFQEQYAKERENEPIGRVEQIREPIRREEVKVEEVKKETPTLSRPEIKPGYEVEKPFIDENSGFSQMNPSLDQAFGSAQRIETNEYSEFTPLMYGSSGSPFSRYMNVSPIPQTPEVKEEKIEVVKEQPSIRIGVNGPEFKEEDEDINFIDSFSPQVQPQPLPQPKVEERLVDESLVRIQPQFSEIREHVEEVKPQIQIQPEVVEVKKPRQRVVWVAPSTDLLMTYDIEDARELNEKVAAERMVAINRILDDFRIGARSVGYTIGPSVTRFNIEYDPNVSVKSVEKYTSDISRRLGGVVSRFAAIIPGESYSGLEVPNATITTVSFKDVVTALPDAKKKPLEVAFGKDISGNVIHADFREFPHLLVAGTTGSGKSIFVHSIISTMIMRNSPDDLKLVLVDPKKVEMTKYRDMPHLLCPIITEAEKAKVCMQKLVEEMERRYSLFANDPEISDIKGYNEKAKEKGDELLPSIVVVLDEYADLVDSCKEISQPVVSIAQKARSAGIHLLIATQRPSTNVITGVIKGNLPTRVALTTSSYTDSMTIIGEGGAETLLGKGDMLVQSPLISRTGVTRLQGCYIQNKEIVHIVNYLKEHYETHYDENYLDLVDHSKEPAVPVLAGEVERETSQEEENRYQSIKEWVMGQEFVSMSKIQRECAVGFNRAGRFFSRLQKEGVVATQTDGSSKGCRVLIHDKYYSGDDDYIVTSDELRS